MIGTIPVLILSAILPAFSLPGAGSSALSLDEAVARALTRNPAILRAEREIEAARGRRLQLEAAPNPELVFSREGLPLGRDGKETETSLGLRQTFEFPGKRGLRGQVGRRDEESAVLDLERLKISVAAEVEKAYFKAVFSEKASASLKSLLATLREYIDLAAGKYKAGQAPYLDVIRGRVEALKARNDLIESERELRRDIASLRILMGNPGTEPLSLTTGLAFVPFGRTLEDLLAEASNRPSLKLLAARRSRAEASLALSRKAGYPDLSLGLFAPSLRTGAWGFELGLCIPLWTKAFSGGVRETQAVLDQESISLEAMRMRIRTALEQSLDEVLALEEELRTYTDSLLPEVEEAVKAAMTGYAYGKTDSLGLLDVLRSRKEAQREHFRALLNYRIALADIRTAGEDPVL